MLDRPITREDVEEARAAIHGGVEAVGAYLIQHKGGVTVRNVEGAVFYMAHLEHGTLNERPCTAAMALGKARQMWPHGEFDHVLDAAGQRLQEDDELVAGSTVLVLSAAEVGRQGGELG